MRLSKDNPVKKLWDLLRASNLRDDLDEDSFGEAAMYLEEEDSFGEAAMYLEEEIDIDVPLTKRVQSEK